MTRMVRGQHVHQAAGQAYRAWACSPHLPVHWRACPRHADSCRHLRTRVVVLTCRADAAASSSSRSSAGRQEPVRVLVVGGGGREHALAWKLAQSDLCAALFCGPGNAGTALERGVTTVPDLPVDSNEQVVQWCRQQGIQLVVVGPEVPLVAGLADALNEAGIWAFGPSAAAARLEGSKQFMKDLCRKYNVPTAEYETFTDAAAAKEYIRARGAPIVVKADGLAAGKGVVVARTQQEAEQAVDDALLNQRFGAAGSKVVVEEFLGGEEASFFALLDGSACLALGSAQDHKAVGEGDTGPNTGGMGAYSPAPVLTPALQAQVMEEIVQRTADALVAEGCPFRGVLFAGLMIQDGRAKLLEHNVRFGDPECQVLMPRLRTDLLALMLAACRGRLAQAGEVEWAPQAALTVVMAARGYPEAYAKGSHITGLKRVKNAKVFHAGTKLGAGGEVLANGGRVLNVTALGNDVAQAQSNAYKAVEQIHWSDGFFRRDIGWRAVERLQQQH